MGNDQDGVLKLYNYLCIGVSKKKKHYKQKHYQRLISCLDKHVPNIPEFKILKEDFSSLYIFLKKLNEFLLLFGFVVCGDWGGGGGERGLSF